MRKHFIILCFLFFRGNPSWSQETVTGQTASAYAFLVDSIIIKELKNYPHLKNRKVSIGPMNSSKQLHAEGMENFWQHLAVYFDNTSNNKFLDSVFDASPGFDLEAVRAHSVNPQKLALLDTNRHAIDLEYAMENISVCYVSKAVFSRDRKNCVLSYTELAGGTYTIVLQKNKEGWALIYKKMDMLE